MHVSSSENHNMQPNATGQFAQGFFNMLTAVTASLVCTLYFVVTADVDVLAVPVS